MGPSLFDVRESSVRCNTSYILTQLCWTSAQLYGVAYWLCGTLVYLHRLSIMDSSQLYEVNVWDSCTDWMRLEQQYGFDAFGAAVRFGCILNSCTK